jgi:four helix bundle protein
MEEETLGPDYRRLSAWSEACDLAVSVPSNIAEGNAKGTNKDALKFLYIARGSLAELETQVLICIKAGFLRESEVLLVVEHCNRVGRLIGGLIRYRKSRPD